MTYIELVRAVRSRVGMQGTGPSSINGAVGAEVDLVNSVSDSWSDLQNYRDDWKWMRGRVSFNTVVGTTEYTPSTIFNTSNHRLSKWRKDSFYFLDTDGKYRKVNSYYDYDSFCELFINDTTNNKISAFSVRPDNSAICINRPDSIYPIRLDYQKAPQQLSTDSDIPELPPQFHMLIVYEAVAKYCATVSSPELYDKYSYDHSKLLGALMRNQLPSKNLKVYGIA